LHDGWQAKRRLSHKISTAMIDQCYQRAREAGAIGGKLLGAGGGGFLLLFVPPPMRDKVKLALSDLKQVAFAFEQSGSALLCYRPAQSGQGDFC
jgi:D-glycero-alpha-D-manno-heptose-7-phosphate kinase